MSKLRVGVIGVGHMGNYHARIYDQLKKYIDFVGVCDIRKSRANEIAELYGTKAFYNYQDLLPYVDAVNIAVPTSEHYKVAKGCLETGKHILLEKPMTRIYEDAVELIDIAEERNLVFHVGHVERFNAAVLELMDVVKGETPIFLEAKRFGPAGERERTSGVILDLMIHDIDIILGLVRSGVAGIAAVGKQVYSRFEDIANVQLYFENGTFATISASRVSQTKIRTLSITMPDYDIFLDYASEDVSIHRKAKTSDNVVGGKMKQVQDSYVERLTVNRDNPLRLEIEHFVNCIQDHEKPIYSAMDNLRSLKIALKALEITEKNIKG